jgi:hypothetical protein
MLHRQVPVASFQRAQNGRTPPLGDHLNLYGFWNGTAFVTESGDLHMLLQCDGWQSGPALRDPCASDSSRSLADFSQLLGVEGIVRELVGQG